MRVRWLTPRDRPAGCEAPRDRITSSRGGRRPRVRTALRLAPPSILIVDVGMPKLNSSSRRARAEADAAPRVIS